MSYDPKNGCELCLCSPCVCDVGTPDDQQRNREHALTPETAQDGDVCRGAARWCEDLDAATSFADGGNNWARALPRFTAA